MVEETATILDISMTPAKPTQMPAMMYTSKSYPVDFDTGIFCRHIVTADGKNEGAEFCFNKYERHR